MRWGALASAGASLSAPAARSARVMPLRGASAVRGGLYGFDEATLAVTPRRGHVRAGRTRLCAYALRAGRTVAHVARLVAFGPRVADAPDAPVFPWAHDVIVVGWSVFAVIALAFGVIWARRWRGLRGGSRLRPRRVRRRRVRGGAVRGPAYGAAPEGYVLGLARGGAGGGLVAVPEVELVRHTLVLGATGAGKTVTLGVMVAEALHRGHGVVLVDLKGDTQFAARLADEAQAAGRAFSFWGIESGIAWNPLAAGGPSELKDKLIGLEQWTEPHYKRAAERYLQAVFRVLNANGTSATLARVVGLMRTEALRAQTRQAPQDFADEIDAYLDSLDGSPRSAISGLEPAGGDHRIERRGALRAAGGRGAGPRRRARPGRPGGVLAQQPPLRGAGGADRRAHHPGPQDDRRRAHRTPHPNEP
jgi:uncharacterized protein DUF87